MPSPLSVVYVLTNPAMPGLVKIGQTSQEDAQVRIAQLNSTGVPFPFKLEFACKVPNPDEVEEALHKAFAPDRVNPRREFFKIDADQAIAILKLLHTEDATREVEPRSVDPEEEQAAERYRAARRPNFNFQDMGIPIGSTLESTEAGRTVRVIGPRKVLLGDEEMYLRAASKQILGRDNVASSGQCWTFKGKPIDELYEETYEAEV
jgi:hypothetical protein